MKTKTIVLLAVAGVCGISLGYMALGRANAQGALSGTKGLSLPILVKGGGGLTQEEIDSSWSTPEQKIFCTKFPNSPLCKKDWASNPSGPSVQPLNPNGYGVSYPVPVLKSSVIA